MPLLQKKHRFHSSQYEDSGKDMVFSLMEGSGGEGIGVDVLEVEWWKIPRKHGMHK